MSMWLPHRLLFQSGLMIMLASAATAQAEPSGKPLGILLAAGDIAKCGKDAYNQQATADLLGREIFAANAAGIPIRVLALGDLAYPNGSRQELECFQESWGKYLEYLLPVPGNHEYQSKDAEPYFSYFEEKGKTIVSQNGPKTGFYQLNFPEAGPARWHLIALNSRDRGPTPEQMAWLENDLATDKQRCVLAFAHFFRFSSGRHGHEPPSYQKAKRRNLKRKPRPDPRMKEVFARLHASGASVLISGHDHHYEAFAPQDSEGKAVPNGVRSFIVGTGGAPLYSENYGRHWPNSDQKKYQAKWFGVLKLELFETHYIWRFVPTSNSSAVPADVTSPVTNDCNMRTEAKKP